MNNRLLKHLATCKKCRIDDKYAANHPVDCMICHKTLKNGVRYYGLEATCLERDTGAYAAVCLDCHDLIIDYSPYNKDKLLKDYRKAMDEFKEKIRRSIEKI